MRLNTHPTFEAPVTVRWPDGSTEEFRAAFTALPIDEFNALDLGTSQGAGEFLEKALKETFDVEDMEGNPLTYGAELKATLLNSHYIRHALVAAYYKALSGN